MEGGSRSSPLMTVAPVVVNPEIASNIASVNERCKLTENKNGRVPKVPSTDQKSAVTKKPSRVRRSALLARAGNHKVIPAAKVIPKDNKNAMELRSEERRGGR